MKSFLQLIRANMGVLHETNTPKQKHPWHDIAVSSGMKMNGPQYATASTRSKGVVAHTYIDPKTGKLLKLYQHKDRQHYAIRHKSGKVATGQTSVGLKNHLKENNDVGTEMSEEMFENFDPFMTEDKPNNTYCNKSTWNENSGFMLMIGEKFISLKGGLGTGSTGKTKSEFEKTGHKFEPISEGPKMTDSLSDIPDDNYDKKDVAEGSPTRIPSSGSSVPPPPVKFPTPKKTQGGPIHPPTVREVMGEPTFTGLVKKNVSGDDTATGPVDTFSGGVPLNMDQNHIKKENITPNDYAPNDYSPRVAPGNNIMPEGFADPSNHPFHSAVIKKGFEHKSSGSALGAATHSYSHPALGNLELKTTSNKTPSWHHKGKSGDSPHTLAGHLMMQEGILDFLKKKPADKFAKDTAMGPEYSTSQHGNHGDIEPSSVKTMIPTWKTAGKLKTEEPDTSMTGDKFKDISKNPTKYRMEPPEPVTRNPQDKNGREDPFEEKQ